MPPMRFPVSAKTGENVERFWRRSCTACRRRQGDAEAPLQALIFDSWFDSYRGVIVLARVMQGTLRKGARIRLMSNGRVFDVESLGVLTPKPVEVDELAAGEVGFFVANIKNVADTKIGDTITEDERPAKEPLPGFEDIKSMVFAGIYTVDSHEHTLLREALEKLRLNDSSFFFEPESSVALGFGFRCGFLGLLHMEIIQERLEREYDLDLITTAPGVRYKITSDRRQRDRGRQSLALAGSERDRKDRRAGDPGHHPDQRRVRRRDSEAGGRQARTPAELRIRHADARDADLRTAAERDRAGLLRPAENGLPRLRIARLPACRARGSRRW